MRMVVQRARRAEVRVDSQVVARLTRPGLVALVGVTHSDTEAVAAKLADKLWHLRILDPSGYGVPGPDTQHPPQNLAQLSDTQIPSQLSDTQNPPQLSDTQDQPRSSDTRKNQPTPTDQVVDSPPTGNVSAAAVGAPLLIVSQFTLYADTRRGRRPSWSQAAPRDLAEPLVNQVVANLRSAGAEVETGVFGASMEVELVNDGPVTVLLEA